MYSASQCIHRWRASISPSDEVVALIIVRYFSSLCSVMCPQEGSIHSRPFQAVSGFSPLRCKRSTGRCGCMPSSVLFLCVRFQSAVSYPVSTRANGISPSFPVAFRACPAAPEGLLFLSAEIPAGNTHMAGHTGTSQHSPSRVRTVKGFRVASKVSAASVPSSLGVILCTADFQTNQL